MCDAKEFTLYILNMNFKINKNVLSLSGIVWSCALIIWDARVVNNLLLLILFHIHDYILFSLFYEQQFSFCYFRFFFTSLKKIFFVHTWKFIQNKIKFICIHIFFVKIANKMRKKYFKYIIIIKKGFKFWQALNDIQANE